MANQTTTPPAAETEPPGPGTTPFTGTGFFGWLRSLGIPRQPGWIGGVSAGVAARLGIDPLIVRGVFIVFALFGAPAFVLYGAAWLLLPDLNGRIHLEAVFRGVFDTALIGIALFLLVGLFPVGQGVGFDFTPFWGFGDGWGFGWIFRVLWVLLILAGATALIVWLVRRSRDTTTGYGSTPPEEAFAQYEAEHPTSGPATDASATAATATAAATTVPLPPEPPTYPASSDSDASTEAYAEWKLRYEDWRVRNDEWKRSQSEANRAARAQLAADNRRRASEFARQADEARRIRKLTRPRTSFAYIVATLGAALVAGSIAAITAVDSSARSEYVWTIALCVGTIVTALSMVLAGLLRRRSGFLAAVTIVLLVFSLLTAAAPRHGELVWFSAGESGSVSASYVVPVGDLQLSVDGDRMPAHPTTIDVSQGIGNVTIEITNGARVRIDATYQSGWSNVTDFDEQGVATDARGLSEVSGTGDHFAGVVGGDGDIYAVVTITGLRGGVQVHNYEGN